MSDAAITTIVTGVVTTVGMVVGFLTLWVKLQFAGLKAEEAADKAKTAVDKAQVMSDKLDSNTDITRRIEQHTNGPLVKKIEDIATNSARITQLEARAEAAKLSVENLGKNLDSTRHEIRGHLQTLSNNLALMSISRPPMQPPVEPVAIKTVEPVTVKIDEVKGQR